MTPYKFINRQKNYLQVTMIHILKCSLYNNINMKSPSAEMLRC